MTQEEKDELKDRKWQKKALRKVTQKIRRSFEQKFSFRDELPPELYELYKTFTLKEKMYIVHYFDSPTPYECAIKAGWTETAARTKTKKFRTTAWPILSWLEEKITSKLIDMVVSKNVVSREMIIEKLANMAFPNEPDFENYEAVKNTSIAAAIKKTGVRKVIDHDTGLEVMQKYVKELHDPIRVLELMAKMLGALAPEKSQVQVTSPDGSMSPREVTITVNPVKSNTPK